MARKPKPSGKLNRGPWDAKHIRSAFLSDGWYVDEKGPHNQLRHDTRKGKLTVDEKWTSIRVGDDAFRSWIANGGYSKDELIRLFNS